MLFRHKQKKKPQGAERLARRLSRSAFLISAAVFALVMAFIYVLTCGIIYLATLSECQQNMDYSAALIEAQLHAAAAILDNSPDSMADGDAMATVENIVRHNTGICGSAVALSPRVAQRLHSAPYHMAYAWRQPGTDSVQAKTLGDSVNYDYTHMEWYDVPMRTGRSHWSEPYYDDGGGDMLMCTYSRPLRDAAGKAVGVMTIDISVGDGIARIVEDTDMRFSAYYGGKMYLLSATGQLMAGDTIPGIADELLCKSRLESTGWTLCRTISEDDLEEDCIIALIITVFFYLITIITMLLSTTFIMRRLAKPEVQNQMRLMTDLDMAARIQQGMLPKAAGAGAEGAQAVSAIMTPAKEVGGDFYNYIADGDRLYFVIADVSGKGMPAALFMAIATELFLVTAPGEDDASRIVEKINRQLSRDNQASMFVTMIVGILHRAKGRLQLCSAGHNPPFIITSRDDAQAPEQIDLPANCPVGLFDGMAYKSVTMPFAAGSRLVLYTDGVTEAENRRKELFGEARLVEVLQSRPHDICAAVCQAVHAFADGAEQSDDITIMTIENQ